jgi:hypothetical protein
MISLLCLCFLGEPPIAKGPSLAQTVPGIYRATGKALDGESYSVAVVVQHISGSQIYKCSSSDGSFGIGIIQGESLCIAWTSKQAQSIANVRFTGRNGLCHWASNPGNGQLVRETWTFLAEAE